MKIAVILNSQSGNRSSKLDRNNLRDAFHGRGLETEFYPVNGRKLSACAKQVAAMDFDAIVVAGGDGSVSTVAGELVGKDKPLGILPAGTFNHFAKDCGIPIDVKEAVMLISEGAPQKLDVGDVNGRIFINNSSVGLYPKAVKLRDRYLHRLGGRKTVAMLKASFAIFQRLPLYRITLQVEHQTIHRITPFVYIGNNRYELDLFKLGRRTTMTGGKLSLYTAQCENRGRVIRFALLGLFNLLSQEKDFNLHLVEEVKLENYRKRVRVATDGEIVSLKPPLHYKIHPKTLLVIMPRDRGSA